MPFNILFSINGNDFVTKVSLELSFYINLAMMIMDTV